MVSITKDFETRQAGCMECGGAKSEDIAELLAHARALDAMLKAHEFDGQETGDGTCISCGQYPHTEDCQLAKLLEGVE